MKFFGLIVALFTLNAKADLTVYTDRPSSRMANAATAYQAKTGQKVIFVEAVYADILKKIQAEGAGTPADLIITKDIVHLAELKNKSLLRPLKHTAATDRVHAHMKDEQNHWIGLSFRARSLVYDASRISPEDVPSYADLAKPEWQGRLCLRTSKGGYNEALTGYLIHTHGETMAREIVAGWVANLARPVFPNDISMMEEIARGNCDVGIANHYYLAQLLAAKPNFPVRMAFLEQEDGGVHTNGMGVGLVVHSEQGELAQEFVDILLSDSIQLELSAAHFDYPVVKGLAPNTHIKDWGSFKMDPAPWGRIGDLAPKARHLMDELGYK